jgi:hypothetical protein
MIGLLRVGEADQRERTGGSTSSGRSFDRCRSPDQRPVWWIIDVKGLVLVERLDGDRSVCGTEQNGEIGETIRRSPRESNLLYQITEPLGLSHANWSVGETLRNNRTNVRAKIAFGALPLS